MYVNLHIYTAYSMQNRVFKLNCNDIIIDVIKNHLITIVRVISFLIGIGNT